MITGYASLTWHLKWVVRFDTREFSFRQSKYGQMCFFLVFWIELFEFTCTGS